MTEWKNIPKYEGIYEASTDGRIRTVEGKTTFTTKHGIRHWKQRELSQIYYNNGYMTTLWKNGKPRKLLVARIIATTFLENLLDSKMTVNHKDGNRKNNSVENLEWLTREDNIRHGFNSGLYPTKSIEIYSCNDNTIFKFISLSGASRFLGQNVKYVSGCLKRNSALFSIDGGIS